MRPALPAGHLLGEYDMKIVIAGLGKVGKTLTKQLTADRHDVVVIDTNPEVVEGIVNVHDVMGVCGNGANYDIQEEAVGEGADLLIATTSSDEINILACLVAKKLGVGHTIARIRNPEYEKQLRFMREELGLSMVINPEKAVAREISRILRFPNALKLESFSKRRIELVEYRIGENNPLDGIRLASLYGSVKAKVLICAVARGQDIFIPSGDFALRQGDKIYLTSSPHELERFFRNLGLFRARASSVMIVGASKIAYYLALELSETGMHLKIIDSSEERCQQMSERLPRTLVIAGDGTDSDLLNEEGISQMDAFVALTGLDETNIILSMYATRQSVGKVVANINRKSFADFVSSENMVDTVFSAGAVTSEMILQYIRAMQNSLGSKIKTLHRIVDERVEALEFGVTENISFVGVPFRELKLRDNLLIAGIVRRSGQIVIPGGNNSLRVGDDVIVVTTDTMLQDLNDIIK